MNTQTENSFSEQREFSFARSLRCIAGLALFTISPQFLMAESLDVNEIIKTWEIAAKSVLSLHIKMEGINNESSASLLGELDDKEKPHAEMPREIEFWYQLDSNHERYDKSNIGHTSNGFLPLKSTVIHTAKDNRTFISGEAGLAPYDEFITRSPSAIQDYEINALRILLNKTNSGDAYFSQYEFELLEGTSQEINGTPHHAIESAAMSGIRIWFEGSHPFKISKIELGHLEVERYGHREYRYEYDTENQQQSNANFLMPNVIETSRFGPLGKLRQHLRSTTISAEINKTIPDDIFKFELTPGSIYSNRTVTPFKAYICLADGTLRQLSKSEVKREEFMYLSSEVKGSRIENQFPRPVPVTMEVNSPPWRKILIALNLVVVALFLFFIWRRNITSAS